MGLQISLELILNSNDMNNRLTKKEKKTKRKEAHKRAILWSERELRRKQLEFTQAKVKLIPHYHWWTKNLNRNSPSAPSQQKIKRRRNSQMTMTALYVATYTNGASVAKIIWWQVPAPSSRIHSWVNFYLYLLHSKKTIQPSTSTVASLLQQPSMD